MRKLIKMSLFLWIVIYAVLFSMLLSYLLDYLSNKIEINRLNGISMEPTISWMDYIIDYKERPSNSSEIKIGDIVSFYNKSLTDALITHRIVGIENKNNITYFIAKGDNVVNETQHIIFEDIKLKVKEICKLCFVYFVFIFFSTFSFLLILIINFFHKADLLHK